MPVVTAVGTITGHAKVKGAGKAIPPGPWANYVAWSLQIYGSTIEGVGYDPFAKNLYVLYPNGQFIIVPNMPIGVTNAIQSAPDRQAYVEALIATAVYPPLPDPFVTAVGTATGMATVMGVGASTLTSVGVAAGAATVSGVVGGSVGSATGVGTATGVGVPIRTSVGSATGMATVSGLSPIIGVGTASGHATATGQSGSTGTASGSGVATGVGASTATSVGSATGSATASGAGTGLIIAVGSATGVGTATGQSGASCPMGSAFADGCPGAPSGVGTTAPGPGQGLYQNAAFFAYCRQSGQAVYTSLPPWNVAGVHFPLGVDASVTLTDASLFTGTGVTYTTTGGLNKLQCNGTGTLNLIGLDFSLHGGIYVRISGAYTQVNITNCKFVRGTGTAGQALLTFVNTQNGNRAITKCFFDSAAQSFPTDTASTINDDWKGGTATYTYFAILNSGQYPISGQISSLTMKYFYIGGYNLIHTAAHGTALINVLNTPNAVIALEDIEFGTIVSLSTVAPSANTSSYEFNSGGHPNTITTGILSSCTIVNNLSGGAGGSPTSETSILATRIANIGTLQVENNYVDPTGSFYNLIQNGVGINIQGYIDNNSTPGTYSGIAGNILTVTGFGGTGFSDIIAAGSTLIGNGVVHGGSPPLMDPVIQPYGTSGTTGTGMTGTYVVSGAAQASRPSGSLLWETTGAVASATFSGNVDMRTGATIAPVGPQWNG